MRVSIYCVNAFASIFEEEQETEIEYKDDDEEDDDDDDKSGTPSR